MDRRLCLITGASAGIGAALARVYAARGWDLALTGRRADRLHQAAEEIRLRFGVETLVVPGDLADPATPERLLAEIEAQGRSVDALVNNAGYSKTSGFESTSFEDHRAFLQVMALAPVELSHRVVPGMIERRFGRILNVCSVAGLLPASAGDSLYGPAKSFLIKASQSLHLELREHGVHVTALCPGYTYSEFHDVNGSRERISQSVPEWLWLDAETVAEAGYEASEANRPVSVPGAPYKAIAALLKVMPDEWTLALTARHAQRLGRL